MKKTLSSILLTIAVAGIGLVALSFAQETLGHSPVDEVGVYYQKDGKWIDLSPEVVNWKTGGVLKRVGTLGVVKGDVNGKLPAADQARLNWHNRLNYWSTPQK